MIPQADLPRTHLEIGRMLLLDATDEELDDELRTSIAVQITTGDAIEVTDGDRSARKIFLVKVGNKWRKCVWDWKLREVVTFLPK